MEKGYEFIEIKISSIGQPVPRFIESVYGGAYKMAGGMSLYLKESIS